MRHTNNTKHIRYEQYESMQDIKERESLEIVDQSQTPRYVSMFEPLLYVPDFTQKDFHYVSTQDFPHREPPLRIWQIQTRSTQLLSPINNLYTRGWHNNNHVSLEG